MNDSCNWRQGYLIMFTIILMYWLNNDTHKEDLVIWLNSSDQRRFDIEVRKLPQQTQLTNAGVAIYARSTTLMKGNAKFVVSICNRYNVSSK